MIFAITDVTTYSPRKRNRCLSTFQEHSSERTRVARPLLFKTFRVPSPCAPRSSCPGRKNTARTPSTLLYNELTVNCRQRMNDRLHFCRALVWFPRHESRDNSRADPDTSDISVDGVINRQIKTVWCLWFLVFLKLFYFSKL